MLVPESGLHNSLPRVIYIMGTARSGSTVLEVMLSAGKGVFAAGEMTSLPEDGFIGNKVCSCGASFCSCEIWGQVSQTLDLDDNSKQRWSRVQRSIDWHNGFLSQLLGFIGTDSQLLYRQHNRSLLAAVSTVTESPLVADSSKYAGRALALHRIANIDLSVICLTRSPRALMASFQKPNKFEQRPKRPFAAFAYYFLTLLSLRIVLLILGKRALPIRYEKLVVDPVGVLEKIEVAFKLDLGEAKKLVVNDSSFSVGHLVTANRIRKENGFMLRNVDRELSPVGMGANIAVIFMRLWQWLLRF